MSSESRIWEIRPFGSMRGGSEVVIGLWPFSLIRSCLLYVRVRRFLAAPIPQLLLSGACAIVLTMKASPTAVFPHRGLAPHQFTPMSGAHQALHRIPGMLFVKSRVSKV